MIVAPRQLAMDGLVGSADTSPDPAGEIPEGTPLLCRLCVGFPRRTRQLEWSDWLTGLLSVSGVNHERWRSQLGRSSALNVQPRKQQLARFFRKSTDKSPHIRFHDVLGVCGIFVRCFGSIEPTGHVLTVIARSPAGAAMKSSSSFLAHRRWYVMQRTDGEWPRSQFTSQRAAPCITSLFTP